MIKPHTDHNAVLPGRPQSSDCFQVVIHKRMVPLKDKWSIDCYWRFHSLTIKLNTACPRNSWGIHSNGDDKWHLRHKLRTRKASMLATCMIMEYTCHWSNVSIDIRNKPLKFQLYWSAYLNSNNTVEYAILSMLESFVSYVCRVYCE